MTLQALAAVLGGTQSLHTNSRDEALACPATRACASPSARSRSSPTRAARRTRRPARRILLPGSPDTIIEARAALLRKIDERGGIFKAIEQGYIQREIQESAFNYQKTVESKEQVIVGLNEFGAPEKINFRLLPPRASKAS